MARKTLYVTEDEMEIWNKADDLLESSISKVLSDALQKEARRLKVIQSLKEDIGRIIFEYGDMDDDRKYRKAFEGKWIVENREIFDPEKVLSGIRTFCWIALTTKEQFLVLIKNQDDYGCYRVFRDFSELCTLKDLSVGFEYSHDQFLTEVGDLIGEEYAEFLPI